MTDSWPPVVVALPARDEAARIGDTLGALAAQARPGERVRVVLLANNCRDDTARRARRGHWPGLDLQVREVTLRGPAAGVVGARRAALDLAADLAGQDGVIVSTDADTRPLPGWLDALRGALVPGVSAAAGRLLLDPQERAGLPAAVRRTHLLDTAYRLAASETRARLCPDPHDPWPRHDQHFGASLALRVSAYRAVGGVPDVAALEDVALVAALRQRDLAVRHTPHARAYTSARRRGRVAVGLSSQLREWERGPATWRVPGAAEIVAGARAEAALRAVWAGQGDPADAARRWRLPPSALVAALDAPTLGAARSAAEEAQRHAGLWAAEFRPVPVLTALQDLRRLLAASGAPSRVGGAAQAGVVGWP